MPNGGVLSIDTELVEASEGRARGLKPGDYVYVTVSDTGVGMDKDVLDRAFDPFFTTKGVGKGSGMGLSMVYGFAKQSGGHVGIESQPGRGTTVHRLSAGRAAMPSRASRSRSRRIDLAAGGHERILLVEDEPHVRRFVSNQLAGLGYSRRRGGSRRAGARYPALRRPISTSCSPIF